VRIAWNILKWTSISLVALIALRIAWGFGFAEWQNRARVGCPILAWITPIHHNDIGPNDSLKLTFGGGLGGGTGTIQIFGDGRLDRDSTITYPDGVILGCPLHERDKHLHIDARIASAIVAKARDGGFCRLCARYRYPGIIYDAGTQTITLTVSGKPHEVSNHAGSPPALFREISDAIEAATPEFPAYASWRTWSHEDEAECSAFKDRQEKINARIEGRAPYY